MHHWGMSSLAKSAAIKILQNLLHYIWLFAKKIKHVLRIVLTSYTQENWVLLTGRKLARSRSKEQNCSLCCLLYILRVTLAFFLTWHYLVIPASLRLSGLKKILTHNHSFLFSCFTQDKIQIPSTGCPQWVRI